ncbi:Aprataxin [Leucoagaricus sp. SymC.cos]|nr:Aprataxin [Leucoagaricus sp. SymC.cos]
MANLTILRTYALKDPATLPASVLFSHSEKTLTIYDAYPKSIFHFLVLPRVLSPTTPTPSATASPQSATATSDLVIPSPSVADLSSLRILLNSKDVSKEQAKQVILSLKEDATRLKDEIEQEMEKRYGFIWDVWIGFHGTPSIEHIHLHVLSADLCSDRMKNKKHYNSFHPKLGFFLHIDEVLAWFEAVPSYYQDMAKLPRKEFENLLKNPLICFRCGVESKNMPSLKAHLQKEWEKLKARAETRKKRKEVSSIPQEPTSTTSFERGDGSPAPKKIKMDKA